MSEVYVLNPTKKMVMGFDGEKEAQLYLQLDPKQFGEKEENKRQFVDEDKKNKLLKEEKAVYHKMDRKYENLVSKLIKNTESSSNEFVRIKKDNVDSVGIVVEMNKEQQERFKSVTTDAIKKNTISLDKDSAGNLNPNDLRVVTIAKMNGNYIPQKDGIDVDNLAKRIDVAMKDDNFKKLNPDFNKFSILTDTQAKESQVFRFAGDKSRHQFSGNMKQAIEDEKKISYKISNLANFSSITTKKVCGKKSDYINMYGRGKDINDAKAILNKHANSVKQAVSKIQTAKVGQTKKQTQVKAKAISY